MDDLQPLGPLPQLIFWEWDVIYNAMNTAMSEFLGFCHRWWRTPHLWHQLKEAPLILVNWWKRVFLEQEKGVSGQTRNWCFWDVGGILNMGLNPGTSNMCPDMIPSRTSQHSPFLSSDFCQQYSWCSSEETHRWLSGLWKEEHCPFNLSSFTIVHPWLTYKAACFGAPACNNEGGRIGLDCN